MNNLKELILFLKDRNNKITENITSKEFFKIFFEILNSIDFLDNYYINNIKDNDRNLFLFLVANIKEFLDKTLYYIENISPDIKSFYTQSLVSEIDYIKNEIIKLKKELFENDSIFKEKENIQKEYNKYVLLIKQKEELIKQKSILDKINIEEKIKEYNSIQEEINNINNIISNLEKTKIIYENKINQNKEIEKDFINLKQQYELNNEFLFEKFLLLLETFKNSINDKKNFYSEQLNLTIQILKDKDKELKAFINDINNRKTFFENKINIINNHFLNNKEIINDIKNLDKGIYQKINKLEENLKELDNDLLKYLESINKINKK